MAFQLKPGETVGKGVRRIVRRQIDGALERLRGGDEGDEVVHDVRKRFKKVRAVLRLVRDELGQKTYRGENSCFRDAGRPLTEVRDAKVLVEALDGLTEHFAGQFAPGLFDTVRAGLMANQQAVRERVLSQELS